jgi:4-hydroxybenzoate polyprenyltransferase
MSDTPQGKLPSPAVAEAAAAGRGESKLRAWLELLRAPNLLTVPGDPIVGFLLALTAEGASAARPGLRMALAAGVSLLMYSAGLLWNDWFDLAEDRRQRPHRPLPRGAVRPITVPLVANVLMVVAIAAAAVAGKTTLYVAIALGALVIGYNALLKRLPLVGPAAMGACRGLSVLLGAAAMGPAGLLHSPVIAYAGGTLLYIATVTWLATEETRRAAVDAKLLLILTAVAAWLVGLVLTIRPQTSGVSWAIPESRFDDFVAVVVAYTLIFIVGGYSVIHVAFRVARLKPGQPRDGDAAPGREIAAAALPEPALVQQTVGHLVRAVIAFQATAAVSLGLRGLCVAAALGGCYLLSRLLGKWFYGS